MLEELRRKLRDDVNPTTTIVVGIVLASLFLLAGGPIWIASRGGHIGSFVFFMAILVGPAAWVLHDARRRGIERPFLWGLFALIGSVIGLVVYLIVRSDRPAQRDCSTCGRPVSTRYTACPFCGSLQTSPRRSCATCHGELELEWRFCPYCRTEVGSAAPRP